MANKKKTITAVLIGAVIGLSAGIWLAFFGGFDDNGKSSESLGNTALEANFTTPEPTPAPSPEPTPTPAPAPAVLAGDNLPLRRYFPWIHDEDFTNAMPLTPYLNNPFVFFAYQVNAAPEVLAYYGIPYHGQVRTAQDWEIRRAEIRDLLMYYYFGYMWSTTYENVVVNTVLPAAERPYGDINITVNENRLDGTPVSYTWNAATVNLPTWQQLYDNGFWSTPNPTPGNPGYGTGGPIIIGGTGGASLEQLHERGIGFVWLNEGGSENRDGPYFELFPFDFYVTQYNTGSLMARAWEVSRVADIFQLNPQWGVNYRALITTGTSFMGKRALFPGVMDDRVAITMPHESGGDGGVAPFRFSHAGRIHFYAHDTFDAQQTNRVHSRHETPRTGNSLRAAGGATGAFVRQTAPYEYSTYRIPFDTHLLIAMTAPTLNNPNRAFIGLETTNFGTWTGWSPSRTVAAAAQEVFHFLGNDNLVFLQKHSNHFPHHTDAPVMFAAVNYLFGDGRVYVEDINDAAYPGLWGTLSALSRTPVEVESAWFPWVRSGVYAVWTETLHITQGLPAQVTAYTNAPDGTTMLLNLWSHGDQNSLWVIENPPQLLNRWTTLVSNGQALFEIPAHETQIGRYELMLLEYTSQNAFFTGIDVHTALRSGATTDNIGGGGGSRLFGFTNQIENPENLRIYTIDHDGTENQITATTWQSGGNWIAPFGVRVRGAEPPGAYVLRNLQFQAMPDFTFEISFANDLHNADQPPSIWRASPEVQHIGPYPHFRVSGSADPAWSRPNASPIAPLPQRPTTFTYLPGAVEFLGNTWVIPFPGAICLRDFGIGFNYSRDFSLEWNDSNTQLTITFHDTENVTTGYIMRIRAKDAPQGNTGNPEVWQASYNTVIRLAAN